jgi:outer membrane beta-barrel protein
MSALRSWTFVLAVVAATSSVAHAENPLLDGQPPIRKARPLLEGRHLLAPQFGMTLADPYQQNLLAGLSYRYHFVSMFGVGLDVWAGGGVDTDLTDDIDRELSRPGRPFELTTTSLQLLGNLALELVPWTGKAMLFSDALLRVDLHLTLGIGVAMVAGGERIDDSVSIAPNFGAGIRLFPSAWLSIGLELRDYLVKRALASRRDGSVPAASFDHNWLFGLSIGFSFPTTPEVEE